MYSKKHRRKEVNMRGIIKFLSKHFILVPSFISRTYFDFHLNHPLPCFLKKAFLLHQCVFTNTVKFYLGGVLKLYQ